MSRRALCKNQSPRISPPSSRFSFALLAGQPQSFLQLSEIFPRNRSRSLRAGEFLRPTSAPGRLRPATFFQAFVEICITCSWKIHTPSGVAKKLSRVSGCANVIFSCLRSRLKKQLFRSILRRAWTGISANACATSSSVRAFIVRNSPRHCRRFDLEHSHRSSICDDIARRGVVFPVWRPKSILPRCLGARLSFHLALFWCCHCCLSLFSRCCPAPATSW